MTHDRPYRPARPLSEALEVLKSEAGKQFDPRITEAALAIPADRWTDLLGLQAAQKADSESREQSSETAQASVTTQKSPQ